MSNYTKSTNFATKDNLTPGDPLKVVRGTEIDTEFNNIATAVATWVVGAAVYLTAGSVINIEFPNADGMTEKSTNKMLSGNYLITKIRHIIRPTGQAMYTQACEVLKTGFLKE